MQLRLSKHASIRRMQRGITREQIAAALAGPCWELYDGSALWLDQESRAVVIVELDGTISTVYRMRKHDRKRFSRKAVDLDDPCQAV